MLVVIIYAAHRRRREEKSTHRRPNIFFFSAVGSFEFRLKMNIDEYRVSALGFGFDRRINYSAFGRRVRFPVTKK